MSSGAAFITSVSSLPLVDVREENRGLFVNTSNLVGTFYPSQLNLVAYNNGGTIAPQGFWNPVGGDAGPVLVSGNIVRRMLRQAANNGRQGQQLVFPVTGNIAALGIPGIARRRYLFEWSMWGDALEAGHILAGGLSTNNGSAATLPGTDIGGTTSSFHFRRLQAENGGLWQVAWRQGFAASNYIKIPTTLDSLIPRLFKMEFIEGPNGGPGTLTMSIDGAVVATFTGANFPAVTAANFPVWSLNVGNQGPGAGVGFDYIGPEPKFQIWPA